MKRFVETYVVINDMDERFCGMLCPHLQKGGILRTPTCWLFDKRLIRGAPTAIYRCYACHMQAREESHE